MALKDIIFPDANFTISKTGPRPPDMIRHIAVPTFPELKFEWHPVAKKAFQLWKSGETFVLGEEIASGIETLRQFEFAVGLWVKGYGAAKMRIAPKG